MPHRGSEPGFGWNWTFEMAKAGHEVWCFTRPDGRSELELEVRKYPHLQISFVYIDVPKWVNTLFEKRSLFPPFYYLHYLVWQRRAAREALRIDAEVIFDLVHHVTLGSIQLASEMWRLNKPFIFGPVGGGNFPPMAFKKYFYDGWRTEVIRKWTSNILLRFNRNTIKTAKKAALVLATNRDTYEMAKGMGARRVEIFLDTGLPNSFFPDELPVRERGNVLKILWVGRIFARKGLPLVLEALSKVRSDLPFRLTVLGDGNMGKTINSLIEQYGLVEKTDLRGQVPWDEVRRAYLTHHLFMFCSLRDSFGAQFLEAMAYGLPIISLDHHGAGDHIPDGAGLKVAVSDPEQTVNELVAAVEYLYDHPEERNRFGLRGYEFAREQSWTLRAQRMDDLYRNVIFEVNSRKHPNEPSGMIR
jgi:glycosyltransferase involved in cell wall biosynthesis